MYVCMHIGSHDVSMQRQIENLPAFLSHISTEITRAATFLLPT
jgi:hypothetical protein